MEKIIRQLKRVWEHHVYWYSKRIFLAVSLIALVGLLLYLILTVYNLLTPLTNNLLLLLFLLPFMGFYSYLTLSGLYIFLNTPEQAKGIKRKKVIKGWKKKNKGW